MSIAKGSVIGHYRVESRVGAGGMGEVWQVTDLATGQPRALKTLKGGAPDGRLWQRFLGEGRIHSEVSHPGIAAFHEMFLYESSPCIVMEFVPGETLHQRIATHGAIPPAEARRILGLIAEALSYLHGKGILHRDLKPGNVKLTPDGGVKLLDFGIARYRNSSRLTQEGMVVGTPENLPPEVLRGQVAGEASEIWAAGLLGYEMLTGRPPFSDTGNDLHIAILSTQPAAPSSIVPSIPKDLDQTVMRCLEKDPARRIPNCAALRRALEGPVDRRAWLAASPVRTAGIAAGAVLLTLTLAIWFYSMILCCSPPPVEAGAVTVEVTNGSAEVWENGRMVGRTPMTRAARMGETVNLVLRSDGFAEQPVQFEVSERKVYSYTMVPITR